MREKGQALVESAIIFPILLFFLIGVFEVGWVLRSYLVLQNASREAARFSARADYLDFTSTDPGYNQVLTHTLATISNQLPLDFQEKGILQLTYLKVTTPVSLTKYLPTLQYSCPISSPATGVEPIGRKSCIFSTTLISTSHTYSWYKRTFPFSKSFSSTYNINTITQSLVLNNKLNNCQLLCKQGVPKTNAIIIAEIYYEQPHLFGFPLISNPFTDPVPIRVYTIFRRLEVDTKSSN